jgi:hypothetical protein
MGDEPVGNLTPHKLMHRVKSDTDAIYQVQPAGPNLVWTQSMQEDIPPNPVAIKLIEKYPGYQAASIARLRKSSVMKRPIKGSSYRVQTHILDSALC